LFAFRELDEAFRRTERGSTVHSDPREGRNEQHAMLAMLRQAIIERIQRFGVPPPLVQRG